jgi:hypothetical protein
MDLSVGAPQRTEQRDRRSDRVRHLVLVPYCFTTRGTTHDRDVASRPGLIAANRKCRRIPAVQSEKSAAGSDDPIEQRFVDSHVLGT